MPASLFDLTHVIPIIAPEVYMEDYTGVPFDAADPRRDEPMVRLETFGIAYESHHARTDGGNWPYFRPVPGARKDVWLRRTVAVMLAKVNDRLRPFGVEVIVLDGYRTVACQQGMWDFFHAEAARARPGGTADEWRALALEHAVDPSDFSVDNPATWPTHATGAAVDLFLRDCATGAPCDMGGRFEDIVDIATTDYFERKLLAGEIAGDDRRLWYRRLLHWAMQSEGFENDPITFWHYDWGSQLYVKMMQSLRPNAPKAAWYGYVVPPATP
ncbi:MAG TPA: M15 family metallopeptidase [Rhizomicrobium sp.]